MHPPGWSVPFASASRTIHSAARSFTEAPGLANSHLPQISQPAASLGPLSSTSGVLPIRSSAFPRGAGTVIGAGVKPGRACFAMQMRLLPLKSVFLGDADLEAVELVGERDLA